MVEPADLARALFHHGLAEGDLAVAGQHGMIALPDGKNRGGMKHGGDFEPIGRHQGCQGTGTVEVAGGPEVTPQQDSGA